ncbi:probable methyltransferase-like protein 24 [Mercenaria mercenaria]|uniref:probable methyltransferase-like protein 24 n=1 Tax=Mercenaria mercenaria TaxID=6596 RepID=UPI00234F28A7|nr:probable methyltransferase-like protein 24 [Mercenaria mercenaria]
MNVERFATNIVLFGLVLFIIKLYTGKLHEYSYTTKTLLPKVSVDNNGNTYGEYQRLVDTIQVNCENKTRCGPNSYSGYTVCMDRPYKPRTPCIVYSFGSNFMFGFEIDVLKKFKCEIHTFDPSSPVAGHHIPQSINFHLIGLSDTDSTNKLGWKMRKLSSIRKSLNHTDTILDILKLDIEGYEWNAIQQVISARSYTNIKQILLEFHFGKLEKNVYKYGYSMKKGDYWGDIKSSEQLKVLKQLYNSGFHVFYSSRVLHSRIKFPKSYNQSIFALNVISLVNTNLK